LGDEQGLKGQRPDVCTASGAPEGSAWAPTGGFSQIMLQRLHKNHCYGGLAHRS